MVGTASKDRAPPPPGPPSARIAEDRRAAARTAKGAAKKKDAKDAEKTTTGDASADWSENRQNANKLLKLPCFDAVIGLVIGLNAATIGIEQTLVLNNESTLFIRVIESCFLMIYIVELGLRFFAHSWHCLHDRWVKLDVFLVSLGIINSWILEPAFQDAPNEFGPLMLLRSLRLVRLLKTARLLSKDGEFRMMVRGLMHSMMVMVYTLLVLVATLYCFSILAIELITKHPMNMGDNPDTDFQENVAKHFASVPRAMLTLVQFVTIDNASQVYFLLCEKDPWLTLYFVAVLIIVPIILMNVVAAVIFSSLLDATQHELDCAQKAQEKDWGFFISNLKKLFNRIDEDRSGYLTLDELQCMDKRDAEALSNALGCVTPVELFKFLDTEKTGEVSINEFFDCILEKILESGDANLKRMERQIETMHWRLKETFAAQNELSVNMHSLEVNMMSLEGQMAAVLDYWKAKEEPSLHSSGQSNGHAVAAASAGLFANGHAPKNGQASPTNGKVVKSDLGQELAWEAEISSKMQSILEEGMKSALENLRSVVVDGARAMATNASQGGGVVNRAKAPGGPQGRPKPEPRSETVGAPGRTPSGGGRRAASPKARASSNGSSEDKSLPSTLPAVPEPPSGGKARASSNGSREDKSLPAALPAVAEPPAAGKATIETAGETPAQAAKAKRGSSL